MIFGYANTYYIKKICDRKTVCDKTVQSLTVDSW